MRKNVMWHNNYMLTQVTFCSIVIYILVYPKIKSITSIVINVSIAATIILNVNHRCVWNFVTNEQTDRHTDKQTNWLTDQWLAQVGFSDYRNTFSACSHVNLWNKSMIPTLVIEIFEMSRAMLPKYTIHTTEGKMCQSRLNFKPKHLWCNRHSIPQLTPNQP